jgi:hypothetical protein
MDLVTVSLDLLLATLLIAALAYGVRLERRLKALRDGHQVFAQAVRELDQSVLRAESGLDQLRKAGEEARDGLHDRILKAREATAELERLIARAERVRAQPQFAQAQFAQPQFAAQLTPHFAPPQAPQTAAEPAPRRPEARVVVHGEEAAERVAQAILSLGESDRAPELRRPQAKPVMPPVAQAPAEARAEARPSRRPRPVADEDLFETPAPQLRRAIGVRR